MTRLPWQHGRSRTKSGNEKTNLGNPHEWFSRTAGEPSRQALTDLVKAHHRGKSDESGPKGLRSRTNTISSTQSRGTRSRSGSQEDEAWSRPSSQGMSETFVPTSERPDTAGKTRVGKGHRLLQRSSSRLSLSSVGSSSTMGLASPSRSSRIPSSTGRTDDLRSKISAPFDFQHITHTEENQFTGLRRIEESALTHQYIAATTEQRPASALRGIHTSDLPSVANNQSPYTVLTGSPTDVSGAIPQELPQTPPRPLPPPKDDVSLGGRLEVTGLGWLAAHVESASDNFEARSIAAESDLSSKPLPELPVIHAITTEDETAMAMITSPLPSPPLPPSPIHDSFTTSSASTQRQQPSFTARHTGLFPSAKSSMPNLLAVSDMLTAPKTLPRYHSDLALSQHAKKQAVTASTRTSTSFAIIDTMNWEEAVDEAWDDIEGEEDGLNGSSFLSLDCDKPQSDSQHLDILLVESAGSTPLMMASSSAMPNSPDRASSSHGMETHVLASVKEDEPSADLTGLGISPCPAAGTSPAVTRLSRSSSIHFPRRRSSLSYHGNEFLTRSSSQESIILSIASSINGTQRSSNSSVSAVDLMGHYPSQAGTSMTSMHHRSGEGDREEDPVGVARPESGCLPPDILEQISHFGTTFSPDQEAASEDVPPVPPLPGQAYRKSAPKLSVPERRSSIVATGVSGPLRKRSSTWGNRARQSSHVSYSLFPTAPQPPYTAVTSS